MQPASDAPGDAVTAVDDEAATAHTVQERLAGYRRDLYGGRGPGIPEQDWLRNTSLRGSVAGIPTAVSREELHLRTMRIRGERDASAEEAAWAATQFPAEREEFTPLAPPAPSRRRWAGRVVGILGLLGAALWRARRHPDRPTAPGPAGHGG